MNNQLKEAFDTINVDPGIMEETRKRIIEVRNCTAVRMKHGRRAFAIVGTTCLLVLLIAVVVLFRLGFVFPDAVQTPANDTKPSEDNNSNSDGALESVDSSLDSQIIYDDHYIHGQDAQYYFNHSQIFANGSITATKDRYYFLSGPSNRYLFYMDREDMKAVILCDKPDCLHYNTDELDSITECDAHIRDFRSIVRYYDSSLYLTSNQLVRLSLDGTQRDVLPPRWPMLLDNTTIHRGYIYFINEDGLHRLSLNSSDEQPEFLYGGGVVAIGPNIIAYGNYIFFLSIKRDSETIISKETIISNLLRYDIRTGEIITILDEAGPTTFAGGKLIYLPVWESRLYSINLDGSNRQPFADAHGFLYGDDKYVYVDNLRTLMFNKNELFKEYFNYDDDEERKIIVYDIDGNLINQIMIEGNSKFLGGDAYYLFIQSYSENDYGQIMTLWAYDKSDISNKDIEPVKIFEFLPEFHYPDYVETNP